QERRRVLGGAAPAADELGEPNVTRSNGHSYTLGMERRDLPSVDRLLRSPELAGVPRPTALAAARAAIAEAREDIAAGQSPGDVTERALMLAAALEAPRL